LDHQEALGPRGGQEILAAVGVLGPPGLPDLPEHLVCLAHLDPSRTSNPSSTRSSSHRAERRDPRLTRSRTCRHRLDQSDHVDLLELEDLLVHKDSWDPKETQATLDQQVPLVWLDQEA